MIFPNKKKCENNEFKEKVVKRRITEKNEFEICNNADIKIFNKKEVFILSIYLYDEVG